MIIWGIFWGAVLGAFWPGQSDAGVFVGAFFGFFTGLSLRWAVRAEHGSQQKKLLQTARSQSTGATPAAAVAPDQPALISDPLPTGPAGGSTLAQPLAAAESAAANEATAACRFKDDRAPLPPPTPAPARPPIKPVEPNAVELALLAARDWLLGGNTIVRVGLVILFIGLSFLARYAANAGLFPVEFRLSAIALAAIALLAVGFRKRHTKPAFALALQGGGVAVMYLTVFAAFRLYALLPSLMAFALMLVVCSLSCVLALLQNSRALAVAAFAGGFAVPLLLSTGEGSHVALFAYYTVLNLAILFIAWKRSWRILNVVGFVATFGVATTWGILKYLPEQYASTQPFLIGFLLIYVAAAVLYARNTPTRLGNAVDSILVFGTPLIGFGLQAGLVRPFEFGAAFSALAFAAVYLFLAMMLARRALANYRLLIESFIALGIGFATLAVPLALDMRWTSAVWALEGAGAFWVGMRQARWMPRAFGMLLQVAAALVFLSTADSNISAWPFANPAFLGGILIAIPALLTAWWLRGVLPHSGSAVARMYAAIEGQLANAVFLYGFFFWCLAWALEIERALPARTDDAGPLPVLSFSAQQLLTMLEIVVSAGLSMLFGLKKKWAVATWPARLTLPVMIATLFVQGIDGNRVLNTPAWAIWPAVLVMHYAMLRRVDGLGSGLALNRAIHIGSAWLLTFLMADCLWFWIGQGDLWSTSWAGVVLLIAAIGVLLVLAGWAGRANQAASLQTFKWPLNPHACAYYWNAALPLAAMAYLGALAVALHSSGRTDPLPYIPMLNPTDLTIALAIGALVFWRRVVLAAQPAPARSGWVRGRNTLVALALLAFIAVNTVWLRIAHHFFGVRWDAEALFNSFVVQTGYAILWTLLALATMVTAHRRAARPLWLAGAGLLGLVVVKLLLVDLSNIGGAERIVAFIAVGVLMLVVGYFAPLPPKKMPAEPRGPAAGTSPAAAGGENPAAEVELPAV